MMWKELMGSKDYEEYVEMVKGYRCFVWLCVLIGVLLMVLSMGVYLDWLISGIGLYFAGLSLFMFSVMTAQNKMIYKKLVKK